MRDSYRWIRPLLYDWAKWRRKDVIGLGYPSITAEAKLRDSPGVSTKPGKGPEYWPPSDEVKETECNINTLMKIHQIAIWCRYVQEISPERGAIVCAVANSREYWNLVERAERAFGRAVRENSCNVPTDMVKEVK